MSVMNQPYIEAALKTGSTLPKEERPITLIKDIIQDLEKGGEGRMKEQLVLAKVGTGFVQHFDNRLWQSTYGSGIWITNSNATGGQLGQL